MFFWFYKRGFNPLKNNQNPIDVRALKMPRFSCNNTAFLTSRLYFRTIAQCKFWECHNRSAYAQNFFAAYTQVNLFCEIAKKLLSIYREKSCAPPIKQHLFVAIDKKCFFTQNRYTTKIFNCAIQNKIAGNPRLHANIRNIILIPIKKSADFLDKKGAGQISHPI